MHEVRIQLNREVREVRRCLSQPYLLHKILFDITPAGARTLWRLVRDQWIVRSVQPLDWARLDASHKDFGERAHTAFDTIRVAGDVYLVNLYAYARKRPVSGPWRPKTPNEYLEWFEAQGVRYGFDVLESAIVRQEPYRIETSSMPLTALPVELLAAIRISDAQRFSRALEDGIGRLRAFGCGLLLMRHVQ